MNDNNVTNCQLTKLPSGVYELEWWRSSGDPNEPDTRFSKLCTKAQLMKLANSRNTLDLIRAFLQEEFRKGGAIK